MRFLRALFALGLLSVGLGACAKPVSSSTSLVVPARAQDAIITNSVASTVFSSYRQSMPARLFHANTLAGRELDVASNTDLILQPGEVILTFDDGPRPGKTEHILDTLDAYGVKATFLMLGSQAKAHPELAREVAVRGHTIGSHTYDHQDLSKLTRQEAMAEIVKGETAIATVLDGAGNGLSPFFRFPYLAQTGFLRTSMMQGDIVVLDVTIDSKDYYDDTPEAVMQRTLERLDACGSGIILFHDIHQRTVDLLPSFLEELDARGYKVVALEPRYPGVFGRSIITANAEPAMTDAPAVH